MAKYLILGFVYFLLILVNLLVDGWLGLRAVPIVIACFYICRRTAQKEIK